MFSKGKGITVGSRMPSSIVPYSIDSSGHTISTSSLACISHKPAADVAQALLPAGSRLPEFGPVPGVSTPVRRVDTVSERSVGMNATSRAAECGLGAQVGAG
jgi:hypothetical protein